MKNKKIVENLSRTFGKAGLQLKKHSPEIMVVAGVIGVIGSTVMACKATTKLEEVLNETKENIDLVHEATEKGAILDNKTGELVPYTAEDCKKDLTIYYARGGMNIVKLYGPAALLGALSITSIVASHHILRKRNLALSAAYATIDKGFKEYRGRVIERFGKELDRELKYNIKAKEVDVVEVDKDGNPVVDENGEVKTSKKTVNSADVLYSSDYARFFDEYCAGWQKDSEFNLMFLRQQQNYANEKLKAQGYLFLNDVYKMLGIPQTKAGQIVGWIYNSDDKFADNYVDFGIYDLYNEKARDFVNGREKSILLDFNVDGNILDMI
jgi:hypothetical protein